MRHLYWFCCGAALLVLLGLGALYALPAHARPAAEPAARVDRPLDTPTATPTGGGCGVSFSGSAPRCQGNTYTAYFGFYNSCPITFTGATTLVLQVGTTFSGPWTDFDSYSYSQQFAPGASSTLHDFSESSIPGQYVAFRIHYMSQVSNGQQLDIYSQEVALCNQGTVGPTPTGYTLQCYVASRGRQTACTPPGAYSYDFGVYIGCGIPIPGSGSAYFEVAADPGGPWTTYDQHPFSGTYPPGAYSFRGTFTEPPIPAPAAWYRIGFTALFAGNHYVADQTDPAPLCGTPAATVTPTMTRSPTQTPLTGTPTATPSIDLLPDMYLVYDCLGHASEYWLWTLAQPPVGFPVTTTMRFQSAIDFRDYQVPAGGSGFFGVSCPWPCVNGSPPYTLTVDLYNQVNETNENNNSTTTYHLVTPTPCAYPTQTRTATSTATPASALTGTVTPPPTATATGFACSGMSGFGVPLPCTSTATSTPVPMTPSPPPSATPCALSFSDVHPSDYFYQPVQYLACHGVLSGYADGTFRPYNPTTRAQMVKIVVLGFALPLVTQPPTSYTFADVPPSQPFFAVIETAAAQHIISGYTCGGPGELCDGQHRPYFRPNANVTRGQLSKIVVGAAGWAVLNPATPTFSDVLPGSPFYPFVETAACHEVVSGYADHTFRPGANATRGQIAKIVYGALTAGGACQ